VITARIRICALLVPLSACVPEPVPEGPADWEGRLPGQCADGADNDRDGDFDCDDSDCAGAPNCNDEGPVVDCDLVPEEPLSQTRLPGVRGYHGLAFDDAGFVVGSDGSSLIRADREGNAEVWVPGLGGLQQMTYLPDGDLLVSSGEDGGLYRVTPSGGLSIVAPDLHAYSVLLGPNGYVYSGTTLGPASPEIMRTDLETGEMTVFARLEEGVGARSLNFNRDHTLMYVANAGGLATGSVFQIPLDEDLEPIGDPELLGDGMGDGWLDAVAVDACGRLYIPDSRSFVLYRVEPTGEVEPWVDWSRDDGNYGHDAVFGSGIGGWLEDALYMPTPYSGNLAQELVIGVPSRTFEGAILNAP